MRPSPPFNEAESTLREFLRREGLPDDLQWIWRDSIISRRGSGSERRANRSIFIDATQLAALTDVKRYYDAGEKRGLGLALSVFCLADGLSCCYVDVPEDEIAAEYRMMTALRCSIATPVPVAKLIKSVLVASFLRTFIRVPSHAWITDSVPTRSHALSFANAINGESSVLP